MPLIVQSTKHHSPSFNLSIIKSHMQIATKNTTTLAETKVAIVNMYQNGTTANLSPQAQKAAHALAQYIYANKVNKKFVFVLGKDYQDQHLLLLTIANHPAKPKGNAALQKIIRQAPIVAQKSQELSLVKQLPWVTKALQQAKFGILFWIYQHRLSRQEAMPGTSNVPSSIIAVNFQRVKTPQEQLQDKAWAKMIEVIHNLTSHQLKIRGDAQQLPSQTKITASYIVLAIQKIITSNDAISKVAQKLINADHIEMQQVDKTGTIIITIKNYGNDKMITIFGFKATGTPLEVAQAKIKAAKAEVSLPTRLTQVFYGQMPIASNVNAPTKNGVTFTFQSATVVNNKGESILTYEVDAKPQVKGTTPLDITFVVSGFETQAQAIERIAILAAQAVIQNLVANDFTTGIDKTKIASTGAPTQAHVISDIKKQINNRDAQALILPGDITITPDNITQTITIAIHNHGPSKTITIAGFISIADYLKLGTHAIKDYLDQALNAIPSSGGPWVIPNGITSSQFDDYVQAMGDDVLNAKGEVVMNKFAEKYRAKITSLTIPHSFTTIGPWFQHFDKITSLTLNDNLQTIADYAFQNAQLKSLIIPDVVTAIGDKAFGMSPLTSLKLGEKLKTIGISAFYHAKLVSLTIPNAVTTIGTSAFASSPLTSLQLGNHLQTIGEQAFYDAILTSLIIPHSVTFIGSAAFLSCYQVPHTITINIFQDVKLGRGVFRGSVIIKRIPRQPKPPG